MTKQLLMKYIFSFLSLLVISFVVHGQNLQPAGSASFCVGKTVLLSVVGGNSSSFQWQLNGSNTGANTVSYAAGIAGVYRVILNGGGKAGDTLGPVTVTAAPLPVANFSFSPANQCSNIPVTFSNTSTGGATYSWNFGDPNSGTSNTSTAISSSHTFTGAPGNGLQNFTVTQTVTTAAGCITTKTLNVSTTQLPDGTLGGTNKASYNGLIYFKTCGNVSGDFTFSNQSSTSGTNTNYQIVWGDGSPDFNSPTFVTTSHTYSIGSHAMLFIVKGLNGCIDTAKYFAFVGTNPAVGLNNPGNTLACSGTSLTFPITGTSTNAPGTVYTITFNDGTPATNYIHPSVPSSITHIFNTTSCGTTSSNGTNTYNNSFSANIVAENPCASSAATVVPIYISKKPVADFDRSPNDTVCTNALVTLTNTSKNNFVDNGNCQNGNSIWSVSPATGWSISSGNLGNDFGLADPSVWQSGSLILLVKFSEPGVYSIKLKTGNPNCGTDEITKTICVTVPPAPSFSIDNSTGCAPLNVIATNTSTSLNACAPPTYLWSVTYAPSFCGTGESWSFTNGSTTASANPTFIFTGAGTYTIKLDVTNTCGTFSVSKTVTVKQKPQVAINPIAAICANGSISPVAVVAACSPVTPLQYNWTFMDGTPAVSTNLSPGNIGYALLGSHPVQLSVTNECGVTTANAAVIVTSPPVANAGVDKTICSRGSTAIGTAAQQGITYQWVPSTGLSSTNTAVTDVSLTYTGVNADTTYAYIVTASAGSNCSSKDTVLVTVKTRPVVVLKPTSVTICAGSNAQLTAAGAAFYNWLPATGLNNSNRDTVIASPAATATYQVIGTGTNGCTDTASVLVTVQAFPRAGAGNDSIVCNNTSSVKFNGLPAGGFWTGSNISGNGIFNPLLAGNGVYTLYYTVTLNQCSKTDSLSVTVINPPVANAGKDTTVCQNSNSILLSGSPAGGSWSGTNLVTANGTFTPSATGVYNVFYTYGAGSCINKDTVVVKVGPGISNNVISPNQSVCINTLPAQIIGQTATGGNGTAAYQWQFSTDSVTWADVPGETGLNYRPPLLTASAYYRRIAFTALCSGSQGSFSAPVKITVRQNAQALFTASPVTGCTPFNLANAITVAPFPDRDGQYQWYADGIGIGSNSTGIFPGYTITASNDTTIIKLITTSQFGCRPDTVQQQFITVISAPAKFIKDTGYGCGPLPVSFTNTSSIIRNISFNWNFGNGVISNLAQPGTIIYDASPQNRDTTYLVTLKAYNGCDTTVWRDSVKIRANPRAGFGVDTTAGCSPFTVHINNTSSGKSNTYYWNFGNGHLDTTYSTGALNYTYNTGNVIDTFSIQLIAANECKRDTQVIKVRIAPNNIQPRININGNDLYGCAPHIIAINNGTTGASSFTWNFGDGTSALVTNNSPGSVVHAFNNPGTFTIRVDITNGCSDTTVYRSVTVYTKPAATFTTNAATYCQGDTIKVNNTSLHANSYQWFWDDGTGSTGLNPFHIYAAPGIYTIYLRAEKTNNFGVVCYDTIVHSITVLSKPDTRLQTNIRALNCAPFILEVAAPGIINETAQWYFYDSTVTPSVITANGTNAQYTFNRPGSFYVKLIAKNSTGCTDSTIIYFTVAGQPVASFTPAGIFICTRDTTVAYINTTTYDGNDAVKYSWLVDNVALSVNGNFTHHYTASAVTVLPKIFTTWLIASNSVGCRDTAKAILQMNPSAKSKFSFNNPNDCVPFIANIANTARFTTIHKWLVNGVLVSTDAAPSIVIEKPFTAYTIALIADNDYGCKPDTFSVTFTSRIKPAIGFTVSDTLGCTGVLNVGTSNITTNAISYIWNWGDNTPASSFTSPTHLYTTQGQYLITLVASDGVCRDTASQLVKVSAKPVADFSVNTTLTCDTARVQLTNLTINGDTYLWNFGDGTTSTVVDPFKFFAPSLNPYTIKLVAYSTFGCKDSVIKPNLVLAKVPPASGFFISPTPVITVPNYTFSFNNLTLNNTNYQYQWSLGDGTFADTRDVLDHKYADTGNYPIRLIVLDNINNCSDTTLKIARIDGFPGWMYIPNAICPNCLQENLRTFLPKAVGLKEYHLQIFTIWGELIFESTSLDSKGAPNQPWDARYKGSLVQQDAYVWKIQAKFKNGSEWLGMIYPGETKYKKAGSITVVK